jgi:hypothetical protein
MEGGFEPQEEELKKKTAHLSPPGPEGRPRFFFFNFLRVRDAEEGGPGTATSTSPRASAVIAAEVRFVLS